MAPMWGFWDMSLQRAHRRAKFIDRIATVVITTGGAAIIVSVILILLLIVREALPLFFPPAADTAGTPQAQHETRALALDDYVLAAITVDEAGRFRFRGVEDGALRHEAQAKTPTPEATRVVHAEASADGEFTLLWNDGSASLVQAVTAPEFDEEGERSLVHRLREQAALPPPDDAGKQGEDVLLPLQTQAREGEDGGLARVDLMPDGSVRVTAVTIEESLFGDPEEERTVTNLTVPEGGAITALALDSAGMKVYVGTEDGMIHGWTLASGVPRLIESLQAFADLRAITAMSWVLGDVSLAVGDETGLLTTWTPVRPFPDAGERQLTRLRALAQHAGPVHAIMPSMRNKTLASLGEDGVVHLTHMTSDQDLLSLEAPAGSRLLAFAPRADGLAVLTQNEHALVWSVDNPHPEVNFKTLFTRVQYENYDEPRFVWQSSGATDAFEPKLSLIPLIFGSFKGTLYAMLYAVPLALLGAIYTSQFTTPEMRGTIKTSVELMAAVPTVVVGFLIALWLAPIVEDYIVAFLIAMGLFPVVFILFIIALQPFRRFEFIKRVEKGYEFVAILPVLALAAYISYALGGFFEQWLFAGSFQQWLFDTTDARYDQRNSLIIAFGLGFAVIPIIFTISEDSLSNVPPSLRAASMALGASRWQTVWHVILPAASPGIFAGCMIGFGRAIGESMIVLMATGNTPILDWSIFNGMRTLSANIAVEIPEAPVGGTLYRVLFLSAVLLFVITSIVNTAAELVRQYLRGKYAQFQ